MLRVRVRLALSVTLLAAGFGAVALANEPQSKQPSGTDFYGDRLPAGALMRLGTVRLRHLGLRAAFSADGKHLLSFSPRDKTVRQWDPLSGRELQRIPLQGAEQLKINLSDWNERTVAAANAGRLILWDATTGRERRRIETGKNAIQTLALSAAGEILAAIVSNNKGVKVRLWDVASGKELSSLESEQAVYELAISADGKLLGTLTANQELHLWETTTGKRMRTISNPGRQIVFSPDGSKMASVVMDQREGVLKVWSVSEGREVAVMPKVEGADYFSVCFSPDSKLVASGGLRDVLLFDVAGRKLLRRIPSWGWITFAPDGKTLASSVICRIHLWDIATGREIGPRPSHEGPINSLAATPDGRRIVSLSPYGRIVYVWDVSSGKSIAALPAAEGFRDLHTGALSEDGKRFASGDNYGKVRLWDLDTSRELRQMIVEMKKSPTHLNPEIIALRFVSGRDRLAAVSMAWPRMGGFSIKYQLDIWDRKTGKSVIRRALPMNHWPTVFAEDGQTIVFLGTNGLVVQDAATGQEWAALAGGLREPFALSPDGQILAATVSEPNTSPPGAGRVKDPSPDDPRTIVLIELASGKTLLRIETGRSGLRNLAYSPDGQTLAGTIADGFRVWNIATGKEVMRRDLPGSLRGYPFATSLLFFPDGGRLATGLQGGTILIWDLQPQTGRKAIAVKALEGRDLEKRWADLADEDAAKAHRAFWTLTTRPAITIPFLKDHLRPMAALDGKEVNRLISDLSSPEFAVREAAANKLGSFGEQAEPALRQALAGSLSLEARKRLEALLADAIQKSHGPVRSTDTMRTLRAIRVLEQIGNQDARQVLQKLVSGDPAARATRQTKEALQRGERRTAIAGKR